MSSLDNKIEKSTKNPYSAGIMNMKMGAGKLLSNDLEKVLDLLEYRFEIRQASSEIPDLKNKVEIPIEFGDLKRGGLEFESFVNALHSLVEQYPEIEIIYVSDSIDKIPEIGTQARALREISLELQGYDLKSTLADVTVPLQFKELLKKARENNSGKSPHIVIDDTPEGANWNSLQIRFLNGRTLFVSIPTKRWNRDIDCSQLGLEKKIGQRTMVRWNLLEETAANSGLIRLISNKIKPESKRRQVTDLRNLLKEVFPNLEGDPFEPTGGDGYQSTFEMLPEQREESDYSE